jgi:ribokinase
MTVRFDLLVVGDANPDLVLRGDVVPRFGQQEQLLDAADLVLGGSAAIVAAGAARLEVRTAMASRVGTDPFADVVLGALTARGVDVGAVARDPQVPTGLTVVLSAPADRAILTLPGTIPGMTADQVDDDLLRSARHLHVGGWYLMPRLVAGTADLFARARANGLTTSLDTNWDPTGRWDGVLDLLALTDVLLPNVAELLAVTGHDPEHPDPASVRAAADRVRATGTLLAVKAGADGALGWDGDGEHAAPVLPVEVVDTTGAGDSFVAGFLAAHLEGRPFADALRRAAAAGSLSTRAAGGTAAQPTRAELDAALAG